MANVLGLLTLNNTDIIEIDDLPMRESGTLAELGDLALLNKNGASYLFQKSGLDNRLWDLIGDYNPKLVSRAFVDFISNAAVGENGWVSTTSGGTVALASVNNQKVFGVTRLTANNGGATNYAALRSFAGTSFALNNNFIIYKTFLSSSGIANSILKIGFGINAGTTDLADHLIFKLDANTPNWLIESRSASSTTSVNTGIAWAANTWTGLTIHYDGLNNTANFFINEIFAGSVAIGTNKTALTNLGANVQKTSPGGGAATCDIDLFSFVSILNSPRGV